MALGVSTSTAAYPHVFAPGPRLMTSAPARPAATPTDGLPIPQRYGAMAVILLGIAMSVLDGTIVNLALPGIVRDFRADAGASVWVITAYQVATLVMLLPLAMAGDLVGHRRVYLGGLALFTLASLACAFAPSLAVLIAARTAQGLGAAGLMSVNGALVRLTYPAKKLGRGIALNSMAVAFASVAGPSIAAGDALGRVMAVAVRGQRADRRRACSRSPGARCRATRRRRRRGVRLRPLDVALNVAMFGLAAVGADALGVHLGGSSARLGPPAGHRAAPRRRSRPASCTCCGSGARRCRSSRSTCCAFRCSRCRCARRSRRSRRRRWPSSRVPFLLLEAYGRTPRRGRPDHHRVADRDAGARRRSRGG